MIFGNTRRIVLLIVVAALTVWGCKTKEDQILEEMVKGQRALSKGEMSDAASAFEAVLALDPKATDAISGLAKAYLGMDKPKKAVKLLKTCNTDACRTLFSEVAEKERAAIFSKPVSPGKIDEIIKIFEDPQSDPNKWCGFVTVLQHAVSDRDKFSDEALAAFSKSLGREALNIEEGNLKHMATGEVLAKNAGTSYDGPLDCEEMNKTVMELYGKVNAIHKIMVGQEGPVAQSGASKVVNAFMYYALYARLEALRHPETKTAESDKTEAPQDSAAGNISAPPAGLFATAKKTP